MKKILVGIDLSKTGYVWLVVRAMDLAKHVDGKIDLVYITSQKTEGQEPTHKQKLEELMEHIEPACRGEVQIVDGQVEKVLDEKSSDYDILVVGPREPAGFRRLFEGPMAIRVIAGARCPVFVPRIEQPKTEFPRMLLGIDLRRGDAGARVAAAGQWALALGAKLDIVFCEQSASKRVEEQIGRDIARKQWEARRETNREELQKLVDEKLDDATRGQAILHEDRPDQGLVDLSKNYDVVVVGTADITTATLLLGSVSVYVVRNANCDVLTLPV